MINNIFILDNTRTEFFGCQCSDLTHTLLFTLDEKDSEGFYVCFFVMQWRGLWERLKLVFHYLFKSSYAENGIFDTTIILHKDYERLYEIMSFGSFKNKHIDAPNKYSVNCEQYTLEFIYEEDFLDMPNHPVPEVLTMIQFKPTGKFGKIVNSCRYVLGYMGKYGDKESGWITRSDAEQIQAMLKKAIIAKDAILTNA